MVKTFIIFVFIMFSCVEHVTILEIKNQNISPLLFSDLESFLHEGLKRGHKLDVPKNFVFIYTDTLSSLGLSIQDEKENKIVLINTRTSTYPSHIKEFISYHELGHSLLGLKHKNCYCIMSKDYFSSSSVYQQHREKLLDQLFDY